MRSGISHSPLLQAIYAHAASEPDKVAMVATNGGEITYSGLVNSIERASAFLRTAGVKTGDRVMLSAQKEIEFVYFYFGAHLAGIINVVVDAKNNADHLEYINSVTNPALAIGMKLEGRPSFEYDSIKFPSEPDSLHAPSVTPESTADVMFTSGTTGNPKGVRLSHFNIFSSAANINGFIKNTGADIELLGLPICHSFGLGRLRCNMLSGGTVILHNGFANLKSVFDTIARYQVTGFGMVPAVWAYIKKFSGMRIGQYASQIRYIEIGSAAMPPEDKKILAGLFPDTRICMHYGLTEASRAAFMEFHENISDLSTAGKSVSPLVDIMIADENGKKAAPGQEGEICIKGNMVTSSYYDESDNEGAFVNGYFRTGDWGYMSDDDRLYLVARKKELINVGGKKVSPVEIEEALAKIGVGESMCVAARDPDGILGEVPKAMLVRGTFSISIDEIKNGLRQLLEVYKLPRIYEIVDSIPKTPSGKKKRTV